MSNEKLDGGPELKFAKIHEGVEMSSEQYYIYHAPGQPQPDDLTGWEFWDLSDNRYNIRASAAEGKKLNPDIDYRKPVTAEQLRDHLSAEIDSTFEGEAERRSFYGMKAWPCDRHGGYNVLDFRAPISTDELILSQHGKVIQARSTGILTPHPILEKIREPIMADTVLNKATMEVSFDADGIWSSIGLWDGLTVKKAVCTHSVKGTSSFRYTNDPDSESTYSKWVTPTDAHVQKLGRLACQVRDYEEDEWVDAELWGVSEVANYTFISPLSSYRYCRIDSRLLKGTE